MVDENSSFNEKMLEELTKIRTLLTPPPPPPAPKNRKEEFKQFIEKYKIFGMAIAFIMGVYVGNVIKAIVDDLIMPIVEFLLPPGIGWESWTLGPFRIGHLLGTAITFLIVAYMIFWMVKMLNKYNIK